MRRRAAAFVLVGAGALVACQVIAGIERVGKVTEGAEGGTSSSSSSSGAVQNPNDPCKHVEAPPQPAASDPGADLTPFYLATKTLSLTKPAANGIMGLDLDNSCTCDPRAGTAFDGGASCVPLAGTKVACDLDGGIDNQGLSLFSTLFGEVKAATGQDYEASLDDDLTSGKRTIMLYVKGWNGKPNDIDVQIALFISNGTFPDDPNGLPYTMPKWDGHDVWSYPSDIKPINGQFVPTSVEPAYVSNSRLVAQNGIAVTIIFGSTGLEFGDSVVLGDLAIDPTTQLVSFTGIIGGRIKQSDLLGAAGQIKTSASAYVCNDQGGFAYGLVKSGICPSADIVSTHHNDFTSSTCDSISSTLAVTSFQANLGGTAPVEPTNNGTNPCTPGQTTAPPYTCP